MPTIEEDLRITTDYEWDVERLDETDNIYHTFCESAAHAVAESKDEPSGAEIVLVWRRGSNMDGVLDQAWAYITPDGKLPEFFAVPNAEGVYVPMGHRVPKRFHAELAKALSVR